jgi:hypothetical protein
MQLSLSRWLSKTCRCLSMWRMPSLLKLGEGLGTSSTPQVVRGGQPKLIDDRPKRETMSLEEATVSNM